MKRRSALPALILVLMLSTGCGAHVRDAEVYKAELQFFEKLSLEQADLLEGFVRAHCPCNQGVFALTECEKAAEAVVVARARVRWHVQVSLSNAGIVEGEISDPPEIPPATSLCP